MKAILLAVLAILLPAYCSSLTATEQQTLANFDAEISRLKLRLQHLKMNLTTKVESLNKDIQTQFTSIDADITTRLNSTKNIRFAAVKKINELFSSRKISFRNSLRRRTLNLMNAHYKTQFSSAQRSRNNATNTLIQHVNGLNSQIHKDRFCKYCKGISLFYNIPL